MSKVLRYFLFSSLVLSVLFLASCGEDTETPGGTLSVSTNPSDDQTVSPGDTVDIVVTLANASAEAEVTALSDAGGDFVDQDNKAMSGETVSFIVPADAEEGDEITLTFTVTDDGMQANSQLTLTVETTLVDIVVNSDDFTILALALTEAGLVDALQGAGPFTVFAPNDDAFTAAGITSADDFPAEEDLAPVLQYHVLSGLFLSTDLESGYYETLSGDSVYIDVTDNGVFVNGAEVVTADLEAGNGVIHEIGEVLIPDVTTYEAFLLAAPTGEETSETFFSTVDGEIYSYDGVMSTSDPVSGTIDFGYYYGANANATLASPNAYPQDIYNGLAAWNTRNTSVFKSTNLSPEAFDAIASSQGDDIEAEFEVGTTLNNSGRATGLAANDIIAFQTSDGRFGLIKVVEVVDGNGDGLFTGSSDGIRIEVKVTQ